ncbi:MAG TPA: tyrosine-protein phosphatase, partial [Novosphingobium sp.]|nr:tyrosine-protein phosphatase [Novosphingobium sp.]
LPLQGGRNFRDLGGYRTADGHHVKWGLLYRSGAMHGLTGADYALLESRGIRTVCDLRDARERAAEPADWPPAHAPRQLFDAYTLDVKALMPPGDPQGWRVGQVRAAMIASYPRLLVLLNGQYRRMFARLLAGEAPLAFNCTAGKDRTGIAAALILTALGVPRHTIVADYMLSNRYLDLAVMRGSARAPANMASGKSALGMLASLPPPVFHALMAADPAYIGAALAVMERHRGGPAGYLAQEMGLSAQDIRQLRALYLE